MPRKKKQNIESKLHTKSVAQLDEEIKKILAQDHEDQPLDGLFHSDGQPWCGANPEPLINGVPVKEYLKRKGLDENTQ